MAVNPERWQQIKHLFEAAVDLSPLERPSYLDRVCAGDSPLRQEMDSLLKAYDEGSLDGSPVKAMAAEVIARDPAAVVGTLIAHYKILSLLGQGGMGEVYLAYDTKLGRKVALKLLPVSLSSDEERLRRFEREARSASALNHPNVCVIYEVGETNDGRRFIVMEHIEGVTLRRRLSDGPLPLAEAIKITLQIGDALASAHNAGVVHRDIKPENIMLRSDGYVKVLDFGLAKLTERYGITSDSEARTFPAFNTHSGLLLGTINYLSPEQARRKEVDERTDIWSLAVVLYEMLSGSLPFTGETPSHAIVAILEKEPVPLSRCVPSAPTELDWIVKKALRKDREQRYQTAGEFAVDLGRLRDEVSTAPMSVGERPEKRKSVIPRSLLAVGAALILLAVVGYFLLRGRSAATPGANSINSVAVLPFANMSGDPNMDVLSDGITDSLINDLSQLPKLRVIGRSSVNQYRDKPTDVQTVGRDLIVEAVLTGRIVERAGDLVIYVDLEDARDRHHIWGEHYNYKVSDILAIQTEISRAITQKLRGQISGEDQKRLAKHYTENVDAYQLYMKGRWNWNQRTLEGKKQAAAYFQQAIDLDPKYALAYVGLADTFALNSQVQPRESYLRAKTAAAKALEIDSTLGEAHATQGFIKSHYERDWTGGEDEFKRAIELSPNYANAYYWYADQLLARRRFPQADHEFEKAVELDPFAPIIKTEAGLVYFYQRDYDKAIEHFRKMGDQFQGFFPAHMYLAWAYTQKKMYPEAKAEFQKASDMSSGHTLVLATKGYMYAVSGEKAEALKILKQLTDLASTQYVSPFRFAIVYAGLGDKDKAFQWLNRGYDELDLLLIYMNATPLFDSLRDDPRFAALQQRLGLAQQ